VNASNQLTRNGTRIVDFVEFLEFHYYLEGGAELDPPGAALTADQRADIRAVVVVFAVRTENPAPDTGEFRIRSLVSGARVRNLGFQDIP